MSKTVSLIFIVVAALVYIPAAPLLTEHLISLNLQFSIFTVPVVATCITPYLFVIFWKVQSTKSALTDEPNLIKPVPPVFEESLIIKFENESATPSVVLTNNSESGIDDLIETPSLLSPTTFKDFSKVIVLSTIYSPFLMKMVSPPVAAPTASEIVAYFPSPPIPSTTYVSPLALKLSFEASPIAISSPISAPNV